MSVALRSIEIFAGAGGLALGSARAGFEHEAVVELDRDACETLRENKRRGLSHIGDWRIHKADVKEFDFTPYRGADLLSGGPPCQPFSIGGKHAGHRDRRNLFPFVARAVRQVRPHAILLENVRGLVRPAFLRYFEYTLLQLSYPEMERQPDESWTDHLGRLERHHTRGTQKGLTYNVVFQPLNAANYGIPQRRQRVFVVGFRSDLGIEWSFPQPTHSPDALLYSQWVSGDYWERHEIARRARPPHPERLSPRINRLRSRLFPIAEHPWVTVRDVLKDLPDPTAHPTSSVLNHIHNPGARTYPGHTGSPLDEPAKTLKAGDHGVPGGENMMSLPDGSVRYFTVRESARLQTFPDEYFFSGSWSEAMRQLGNAVPVKLAELLAQGIAARLKGSPGSGSGSSR